MSAYCRICNANKNTSKSDTYVACSNCGSFACLQHHVWYGVSKNAFCTVCFPKQAAQAVAGASQALQAVARNTQADGVESLYASLNSITRKFSDMTIEDLIELLNALCAELARRDIANTERPRA